MEQKSRLKALKERLSELDSERLNILNEMELYFNHKKTRRNTTREIILDAVELSREKRGGTFTILELIHYRNKLGRTINSKRPAQYHAAFLSYALKMPNCPISRTKYGEYCLSGQVNDK